MDVWRHRDIRADIEAICDWPVYLQNDATAACGAELAFGRHDHLRDFIYFYVGTFVGGGVVLNGSLYSGPSGNAGALGPMPIPGPGGQPVRLMDKASLVVLERKLVSNGIDPTTLWRSKDDWEQYRPEAGRWLEQAASGLAHAILASVAVIDFEAAVIDGSFPETIRSELVSRVDRHLSKQDLRGLSVPAVLEGSIGSVARALGGASLPLFDRYLIDQNSLMRETG
jgi:predicted NBD/HSP70 family sugar kinase